MEEKMNVCKKCGEVKGHNENCPFCEEDKIEVVDYHFPNNDENFMEATLDLNGYIFKGELKSKKLIEREEPKSIRDMEHKSSDEIWYEYENSDRNVNWIEEIKLRDEAIKEIRNIDESIENGRRYLPDDKNLLLHRLLGKREYIMWKNNLEEEDLK
jgi:hypothetical protein